MLARAPCVTLAVLRFRFGFPRGFTGLGCGPGDAGPKRQVGMEPRLHVHAIGPRGFGGGVAAIAHVAAEARAGREAGIHVCGALAATRALTERSCLGRLLEMGAVGRSR